MSFLICFFVIRFCGQKGVNGVWRFCYLLYFLFSVVLENISVLSFLVCLVYCVWISGREVFCFLIVECVQLMQMFMLQLVIVFSMFINGKNFLCGVGLVIVLQCLSIRLQDQFQLVIFFNECVKVLVVCVMFGLFVSGVV